MEVMVTLVYTPKNKDNIYKVSKKDMNGVGLIMVVK